MPAATEQIHDREVGLVLIPVSSLSTPPENEAVYRSIREDDPEVVELAESILAHGLLHPLTVSADWYVLDGNRRLAACRVAGIEAVLCRLRLDVRRGDPAFLKLLVEANRQRIKTPAERFHEELALVDPADAYTTLLARRERESCNCLDLSAAVSVGNARRRAEIGESMRPLLNAVVHILEENRQYWPMSDRQVHYFLLNDPPEYGNARQGGRRYRNDRGSYKALCDLLTRARLAGLVPFEAIGDATRPFTKWEVWPEVGAYAHECLENLFLGYWRDLLRSQPNHVEIWAEKLTVQNVVKRVASRYTMPLTIGRGYSSLDPRWKLAERFRASGKTRLVLLVLTDHDPDGEAILANLGASLKDEFGIDSIHLVKAAVTREQVVEMGLKPSMEAKPSSVHYKRFRDAHGRHAYELESIRPEALESILEGAIRANLDLSLFDRERSEEQREAAEIVARRQMVLEVLGKEF